MSASPRDNMLKMRYLLVTGVLETEKTYLAILELLIHVSFGVDIHIRALLSVLSVWCVYNI